MTVLTYGFHKNFAMKYGFMLGYMFRAILCGFIAIALKGSPMLQIVLYLILSIFFILLIFTKKPAMIRLGNLELIVYETIIMVTLCFAMALVANYVNGNSNHDELTLGTHVIIGFIVLYVFEILFAIINIVHAIKSRCWQKKQEHS